MFSKYQLNTYSSELNTAKVLVRNKSQGYVSLVFSSIMISKEYNNKFMYQLMVMYTQKEIELKYIINNNRISNLLTINNNLQLQTKV